MSWQQALQERQEVVLATASKTGSPNAIMVISLGLIDNKLLIGACQMKKTLENIKQNNQVSLVVKYNKEYYRIKGSTKIYPSGKYFDIAYSKSSPPMPKSAILITIDEVFDLDKQKVVFINK